jgi:hypothetical protein
MRDLGELAVSLLVAHRFETFAPLVLVDFSLPPLLD